MKPTSRRFLKAAFPSIIVLPAMAHLATAAVITPDGFGNVLVTPADTGAHNIQTGFFPVTGAHEIRVDAGATLNPASGDVIEVQVFDASGATYTINNKGTLSALGGLPGQHGIDTIDMAGARPAITVNNDFVISGFSAIRANNTLVLTNKGTLTGTGFSDGAVFAKNGATITNNDGATITGSAHGIQSELVTGLLTISNDATITGTNFDGITSPGIVHLTNSYQQTLGGASTVTGKVNGVVGLGLGSILANSGSITGTTGDGVRVGTNATVTNYTTFNGSPVFGGRIHGGVNGVVAGDGLLLTNNLVGLISGGTGNGVLSGNAATIYNLGNSNNPLNGPGADNGVIMGGTDGVRVSGASIIHNSGSIQGTVNGVQFLVGSGGILNNSGTISGNTRSVFGASGDEIYNLTLGSRLVGDVNGAGGNDIIHFGAGLTTPGGVGNSISGNITNINTINKTDGGVALIGLVGNPLYTVNVDAITIAAGPNQNGLYINGNINAENGVSRTTLTNNGAELGGTGIWNANLLLQAGGFSAGAIPINLDNTPAHAIGTLGVTGNVDHSAATFIRYDVQPQAYWVNNAVGSGVTTGLSGLEIHGGSTGDLINHSAGTYNLGGSPVIRVSATTNNSVISNGTYFVVDSGAVIAGGLPSMAVQFNPNLINPDLASVFVGSEVIDTAVANTSAVLNLFMASDFINGDTDLVFTVLHDFSGLPGLSANASNLGGALDASINSPDALTQDFIAALDYSDLITVQDTLNSLTPDAVLGAASALVSSNYRIHRLAQDHLAMARAGGRTTLETPATPDGKGGMSPTPTVTTDGSKWNTWGIVSYDWKDSNFGNSSSTGEDASFTAGIDYRLAPDWIVGILLDGSQGNYDSTGGSSDLNSLRIAVYGTYGQATGLYADFLLGYGDHDLDIDRHLGGILGGTSNSSTDASSIQAMLTVGYAMMADNIKHGPFAGMEYQNIDVDGYTQTGLFPIRVNDFDFDSLRLLIGYRAEASYGAFTPYASLAYAHEFENGPIHATAVIPSGADFRVNGGGLESAILISLGTGYAFSPSLGLNVGYHGEIAVNGDGIDSHGASIGLNYKF